jgi:hypothetical protein
VFNADPAILGRSIIVHDQSYTVIGVMPPEMTSPQDSDVWMSMMRRSNNGAWMQRFIHPMIFVWGKLKPGVTVEQARTEMKGIAARLEKTYPTLIARRRRSLPLCWTTWSANIERISDCCSARWYSCC